MTAGVPKATLAALSPMPVPRPKGSAPYSFTDLSERNALKIPGGIGAAPHASHDRVGQAAFEALELRACLPAHHRLKVAHDGGIRVRSDHRTDTIEGFFISPRIFFKGRVHGVFQRFPARGHADDLRAQKLHFADVDGLFFHVGFAHKNAAVQA